jgi:hypothetical protein
MTLKPAALSLAKSHNDLQKRVSNAAFMALLPPDAMAAYSEVNSVSASHAAEFHPSNILNGLTMLKPK